MAEFRINIAGLAEGTYEYDFSSLPSAIGLEEPNYIGQVGARASLEKTRKQLFLRVQATVNARLVCDRCLEEFEQRLNTEYIIVYVSDTHSIEEIDESVEVQFIAQDTTYIDLDEDVRQFLILSVPQKILCSEACKGLCPVCGVNKNMTECHCTIENVDPRWDALRTLLGN
ncbi:MAG: DUF177 domain-containing protein [Bacteroidetes bacterium]|nr:DUF177 domain-containing protein [Bacteroidota bacterium]